MNVLKTKRAFTLIELLGVIAIIALLLAILMPSLRKAKAGAMSAVCRAHLHQWGLAFEMYTSESNGKYMPGYLNSRRDSNPSMKPGFASFIFRK
jgi:prepilin-type N-terminal cleavage/methylation domain-containing protein